MTIKTVGAEWKRFYSDKEFWPEGAYHEDEQITINGNEVLDDFDIDLSSVPDDAAMTVSGGYVQIGNEGPSLESHFKRWRKLQNTAFGSVEAPKDKAEAVRAAIIAAGGTVTGLAP